MTSRTLARDRQSPEADVLSPRKGNEEIVVPVVDRGSGTYRFTVQSGEIDPDAVAHARKGTRSEGSAGFTCVISGAPISGDKIRVEGRAGRLGARLMAVVAEGKRGRIYLEPSGEHARLRETGQSHTSSLTIAPDELILGQVSKNYAR